MVRERVPGLASSAPRQSFVNRFTRESVRSVPNAVLSCAAMTHLRLADPPAHGEARRGTMDTMGAKNDTWMLLQGPLQQLMEQAQQGYAVFDEDDRLRWANPWFRQALGLDPDQFPSWVELMRLGWVRARGTNVVTEDFERWLRSAKSRRGKLAWRTIETSFTDGRWVLTTETTSPSGWMLCVVSDVSELGADWRELRQQRDQALRVSWSDELTGLSNRRYAMNHLGELLQPQRAEALAVVVLDLDHFKSINDSLGSAVGDEVLRHFAAQLQAHARREDLCARLGGEEFLLAVPGQGLEAVLGLLDRLMRVLRGGMPLAGGGTVFYTCSAGLALCAPGESADELLRRADLALWRAKSEGRNRAVLAEDAVPAADAVPPPPPKPHGSFGGR